MNKIIAAVLVFIAGYLVYAGSRLLSGYCWIRTMKACYSFHELNPYEFHPQELRSKSWYYGKYPGYIIGGLISIIVYQIMFF